MIDVAQNRRRQMDRALRWSILLFAGFLFVTQQVYSYGPLVSYDKEINSQPKPQFQGLAGFLLRRLDDLGLRWLTATVLLIAAAFIAYKFKTWRDFCIISNYLFDFINKGIQTISRRFFDLKRKCILRI
jgi:heme/copper-type cytochrome/quinol oxidase subunit 3